MFSFPIRLALLLGGFPLFGAGAPDPAPTPQPAAERLSETRGRVVLNGLWRFQPATLDATAAPHAERWGLIPVPGAWMQQGWAHGRGPLPGVLQRAAGANWEQPEAQVGRAWYEREIAVPAAWEGRRIFVSFQRVATDATIYLDDRPAGTIVWPGGEVDVTSHVKAGERHSLRVLVVATSDPGESIIWMGTTPGQSHVVKSQLPSAGLIGEVWLVSRPPGPVITDVFVQPSVRRRALGLEVELADLPADETLRLEVAVHRWDPTTRRAADEAEKRFDPQTIVARPVPGSPGATTRGNWSFPWEDPRLWEVDQPHLYVARVRICRADGRLVDEQATRFGFREFWVDGRHLILNGIPFRLRPFVNEMGREPVTPETIDGFIAGLRRAGFNSSQHWPNNHEVRGSLFAQRAWMAERADELGWPLLGTALSINPSVFDAQWRSRWEEPGVKERWRGRLEQELRPVRNHPSILAWGTSANIFNHAQDQNPRSLGRRDFAPDLGARPQDAAGREGFGWLKQLDPTRPFFTHAGNATGDIYTANTYLNHTPLQEREEWLSAWARDGQMPYLAVEFGNPLFTDFLRGRAPFARAVVTEPLATEYTAAWVGPAAYAQETSEYRRAIRAQHQSGNLWHNWHPNVGILARDPNVQAYQAALITGTWRAWRTAGISGGMVPWNLLDNTLFAATPPPAPPAPWPEPGRRFAWEPHPWSVALTLFDPARGWTPLAAGRALLDANGPTLAWIAGAGDAGDFYEKQHSYASGATVAKQVALLNDLRTPADFTARVRVRRGDEDLFAQEWSGTLHPAETRLLGFAFPTPTVGEKTGLEIELQAQIAERPHRDAFALRVFPATPAATTPPLHLYDPVGLTARVLETLNQPFHRLPHLATLPAAGSALVVVGRDALTTGVSAAPLLAYARRGGHVLIATQQPDWLRTHLGLRVSQFLSRRVWPTHPAHPLFAGLDAIDLRDWAGESTLVEPRPVYVGAIPAHGWRWGNRGALTAAAIETPHRAGWRPLLRAEFDLAYSPLLERELGRGRILVSTLDFEDHAPRDPAAAQLLRQLLAYASQPAPYTPAHTTVYLGGDTGSRLLQSLALRFEHVSALPTGSAACLAILGEDAAVAPSALEAFARDGGRVLVLARTAPLGPGATHHGAHLAVAPAAAPGLSPLDHHFAWGGLSAADVRFRGETDVALLVERDDLVRHADGLLGLRAMGRGLMVYTQLAPDHLDTDRHPWLRLTRWRHTRAIAQLAANLGATFATDEGLLVPSPEPLYHPDYRTDFVEGDEPARYYRW